MQSYVTFSPDVKVLGEVVVAFLQCVSYKSIAPYLMRHGLLGRHGLQTVDPKQWYHLQDWLNVLHDLLQDHPDAPGHLISIGVAMFDTINLQPSFTELSLEEALIEWATLYAATHRGSNIGEIYTEVLDNGQINVITRVPYPDEIFFGLFYALISNHCPDEKDFILEYDESVTRRDHGGQYTAYHITLYDKRQHGFNQLPGRFRKDRLLLEFPPALNDALINNRILNEMEVNFRLNGKYMRGAISLRPSYGRRYQNSSSIAVIDLTAPDEPSEPAHGKSPTTLTADRLCAESTAMRPVLRQAQVAARAVAPVLIQGQSGTGKNYLARAIHAESSRSDNPLININCRAIPSQYIMQEILGGNGKPNGSQPSQFEIAHHGTLQFTHIDSLPLQLQEALLYVIENRRVVRLGETQQIPVDVRIISTTDQDLERLIAQGKFLSALYYRFKIFHLHMPPLHKRKEDIPLLTSVLLERIADKYGVGSPIYAHEEVMDIFYQYHWPGNIREMETVLEFAYNQRFAQKILVEDLPDFMQEGNLTTHAASYAEPVLTLDEVARKAILRAGWTCEGRVTEMAELLGVSRTTLWRQMKQYNITADYFKA